jgi:hypothetical protein
MTHAEMKSFTPTPDMIRAAENCFAAMAFTETIRPIVEGYQRRILADMRPSIAKKWTTGDRRMKNETILDPERTYLMEDADFQTYLTRTREEQAKAGLHTDSPEFCPLLVAEHLQMQVEHCLIDAMEPVTHITRDMIWKSKNSLENLKKLKDLTLRFMAGFVDTKGTMKRFGIAA